jgi:hypothetical protein
VIVAVVRGVGVRRERGATGVVAVADLVLSQVQQRTQHEAEQPGRGHDERGVLACAGQHEDPWVMLQAGHFVNSRRRYGRGWGVDRARATIR